MRMRPKTLPPTLRDKTRYIAFKLMGEKRFDGEEVKRALWRSFLDTLGIIGTANATPWLIEFDEESQTGIIRVDRAHVEDIRLALVLIKSVSGSRVILRTLGVSGTIKRLRRKFLKDGT